MCVTEQVFIARGSPFLHVREERDFPLDTFMYGTAYLIRTKTDPLSGLLTFVASLPHYGFKLVTFDRTL